MKNWLRLSLLTTAAAGIGLTAFLTWTHLWGSLEGICRAGGGCRVVLSSTYSQYGGVPTATWGLAYYLAVLLVIGITPWLGLRFRAGFERFALGLSFLATGVSVYLTYYSLTALNTTCIYCLTSLGLVVILTGGLVFEELRRQR